MTMKKIILASQSPRRSEILRRASYDFISIPTHVSEIPNKNLNINDQIIDIARRKARFCLSQLQVKGLGAFFVTSADLILAADTMVCLSDKILGKPENEKMAFQFLTLLSEKTHQVKTAVVMIDLTTQDEISLIETTQVTFRKITPTEISDYINTKEPLDKAGAYAIQGIGKKFVTQYDGDFDNVVGLPLHAIEKVFKIKSWTLKLLLPDPIS